MWEISSASITDKRASPTLPFELHEACAAWPEMSPPELRALSDDIFANGLREPISLTPNGQLLDGRNRALACQMAGVEPTTVAYDGDPWLFSLSKNRHRRHLTTDQIAIVAAKLATRGEGGDGSNQHRGATGSAEPVAPALSVSQVAAAAGVPETAIKSAKTVLKDGTPEEIKRVETGAAKLRPTADKVRDRKRSPATIKKAEPAKKAEKVPAADGDPIDAMAREIISKTGDGNWRSLSRVASAVNFAPSAVKDALRRLGPDCVETRKSPIEIEYRIRDSNQPAGKASDLERQLGAANVRIADLEASLAAANAEIAELRALLDAATAPAATSHPDKKKTTPASQSKNKGAKHKTATSTAVAAN
jgi:hypothetical protein